MKVSQVYLFIQVTINCANYIIVLKIDFVVICKDNRFLHPEICCIYFVMIVGTSYVANVSLYK